MEPLVSEADVGTGSGVSHNHRIHAPAASTTARPGCSIEAWRVGVLLVGYLGTLAARPTSPQPIVRIMAPDLEP